MFSGCLISFCLLLFNIVLNITLWTCFPGYIVLWDFDIVNPSWHLKRWWQCGGGGGATSTTATFCLPNRFLAPAAVVITVSGGAKPWGDLRSVDSAALVSTLHWTSVWAASFRTAAAGSHGSWWGWTSHIPAGGGEERGQVSSDLTAQQSDTEPPGPRVKPIAIIKRLHRKYRKHSQQVKLLIITTLLP